MRYLEIRYFNFSDSLLFPFYFMFFLISTFFDNLQVSGISIKSFKIIEARLLEAIVTLQGPKQLFNINFHIHAPGPSTHNIDIETTKYEAFPIL